MSKFSTIIFIIISFFVGFVFTIVPWSVNYAEYKPYWVLALLLYWTVAEPSYVGYIVALILGILYDSISGTDLGQHAICFLLVTATNRRFLGIYRNSGFFFQGFMMLVLTFMYSICNYVLGLLSYERITLNISFWLPILITVFVWSWIDLFFNVIRSSYQKRKTNNFVKGNL